MADHTKQVNLSLMDNGIGRMTACHEIGEGMGCRGVKFQKIVQGAFMIYDGYQQYSSHESFEKS